MAESVVNAVLSNVSTLAVQETTLLCGVSLEVEFLKDELKRLQGFLTDADSKRRIGDSGVAILVSQIRDAVYEADNAIEAVEYMQKRNRLKKGFMGTIARYARLPSDLSALHKIGVEIKRIRRKIFEIFDCANRLKIVDLGNTSVEKVNVIDELPVDYGPMHQNFEDIEIVGFDDEYKEIVEKLLDKEDCLSVVSIVAMGGAGKTTLARKVYTSSRVKQHFGKTAWVTVSQKYKGIELLKDIMKQIMEIRDDTIDKMNVYEVGKKIHEFLSQTRYLVVLDDVWETDAWEQLNRTVKAFPDATNGSRVLLTTRKEDVANHVQLPTHVHPLKKLDEEKSWKLFSSKALPSYKRPISDVDEFEILGKKLAIKCDGLPLALAVLGSYLSKNLNTQAWSDILLDWSSTKNGHTMSKILARSYSDLPDHYIKSCLLYLAPFSKDYNIYVPFLISLWIAEGFIPRTPKHEPEEIAHKYVAELAQRSLVQVTGRSKAHGWIQKIRVHDILRDWCIEKARQDGFLCVVDKTSGPVGVPAADIIQSYRSSYQVFIGRNLQETPNLRALICFNLSTTSFPKLRFLRVLHIENSWTRIKDLSSAIGGCVHLRCLRLIRCDGVTLPSSIGKLLYLQTIDLTGTPSLVPRSIWDIVSLRHVYLCDEFSPPKGVQSKMLQTFELKYFGDEIALNIIVMVRFLCQMTQLTTLSLITYSKKIPASVMNIFPNMPHLVDVALSKMTAIDKFPESHQFPQKLRSFVLYAFAIEQDPMPVLEKLPCLVVLKLGGYSGRTMSCSSWGFPHLQDLELSRAIYTDEWKIEAGAMPKLSHLILKLSEMSKLPNGLLHLQSLNHLELHRMPSISVGNDSTWKELQKKGCKVIKK